MVRLLAVMAALGMAGCAAAVAHDPGLEGLAIAGVAPTTIVPGTQLVVTGASFVDEPWGTARLRLVGTVGDRAVDRSWPARFVDLGMLTVAIDAAMFDELGEGLLRGAARVELVAASDGRAYATAPLRIELVLRRQLAPAVAAIAAGVIFVNDRIEVAGDGFLLGGDEGVTVAQLTGCFAREGDELCRRVSAIELPLVPSAPLSRTRASFAFSPRIAGIRPGSFEGAVAIVNRQAGAAPIAAEPVPVRYEVVGPQVLSVDPPAASLGQYVFVHGGGFVGGEPGSLTELEVSGVLRDAAGARGVELTLIPEVVDGRLLRYALGDDDALGGVIDLRRETGELSGTVTPIVSHGGDRVRGAPRAVTLAIAPVRQVVYLVFEASYVEGLRDFGLRGADRAIRERVAAVCAEAYRGVNLELRTAPPTDFALFSRVELLGVDPNDQGLFGYDNSPGKDSGNLRLHDRLGGVNARTQADGYPGFGGVFVRSLMGFSMHPGRFARSVPGADPVFDEIFDPFRADRGGEPVRSADLAGDLAPLAGDLAPLADGAGCPAAERAQQIRCAIHVLGNLIGGTLAHEIGHSLGLARPYQDGFHDEGDAPNRLMDAGDARPFLERAQLRGQGPAVFCDDEYAYLRRILPSTEPPPAIARPGC